MYVTEQFRITNNGNARAKFWWEASKLGIFTPSPLEDEIDPGKYTTCQVTFTPKGPKPEDEQLIMKIMDGNDVIVKC